MPLLQFTQPGSSNWEDDESKREEGEVGMPKMGDLLLGLRVLLATAISCTLFEMYPTINLPSMSCQTHGIQLMHQDNSYLDNIKIKFNNKILYD